MTDGFLGNGDIIPDLKRKLQFTCSYFANCTTTQHADNTAFPTPDFSPYRHGFGRAASTGVHSRIRRHPLLTKLLKQTTFIDDRPRSNQTSQILTLAYYFRERRLSERDRERGDGGNDSMVPGRVLRIMDSDVLFFFFCVCDCFVVVTFLLGTRVLAPKQEMKDE